MLLNLPLIKNLLVILFAISSYLTMNAQITNSRCHLNLQYGAGILDTTTFNKGSLNFEVHVHDKIGINYNFDFINRKDNYRHIHTPMGLLGGPILIGLGLSNLGDSDTTDGGGIGILLGVLMFALPDGVSGHFPVGYHWDVSPYANLLGIDFIKNKKTDERFIKYACSFGIKTSYMFKERFTALAYIETRKTARHAVSFGAGIGVGILLGDRSENDEFVE